MPSDVYEFVGGPLDGILRAMRLEGRREVIVAGLPAHPMSSYVTDDADGPFPPVVSLIQHRYKVHGNRLIYVYR